MNPILAGVLGASLLMAVLWDAFETIILPRRVHRRFRITRLFYKTTWRVWRGAARLVAHRRREEFLAVYGPLSLLMLLGLWATGIVVAFGILQWAAGSGMSLTGGAAGFASDVYMSGTTFFTLGLGDVVPVTTLAKTLTVIESGTGFAFLAVVIGYLPVTYQAFSRREGPISLLDARAGSPPSAGELLWRHRADVGGEQLGALLHEWERWAAELLESHLSYPPLAYFRSQHNNQSWLTALTSILDASAFAIVGLEGRCASQAQLTFAMSRHAVVDLAQVFSTPPSAPAADRLPPEQLDRLRRRLGDGGIRFSQRGDLADRLAELRRMYEPYVTALAEYLAVQLPPWVRDRHRPDNWQTSAWERPLGWPFRGSPGSPGDDHWTGSP
ncbi:MAG TPA: ion channel [Gemmatimonadales bacterium]|nr:ion channel [Gemmatimonadales bacterium]